MFACPCSRAHPLNNIPRKAAPVGSGVEGNVSHPFDSGVPSMQVIDQINERGAECCIAIVCV